MGLLSFFKRKVKTMDDYFARIETIETREERTLKSELEEVASERELINQMMFAYDKKSKLVLAYNAYFRAAAAVINPMKKVRVGFSNLFKRMQMLPKAAAVKAFKGFAGYVGAAYNKPLGAEVELRQMQVSITQINNALRLAMARESPVYQTASNKIAVIKQQQAVLARYQDILRKEFKDVEDEVLGSMEMVETLQNEQKALNDEMEVLQTIIASRRRAA